MFKRFYFLTILLIIFTACQTQVKKVELTPEIGRKDAERPNRVFIAVMDFKILSSEAAVQGFSKDIPQSLIRAFLNGKYIKPVEREELEKAAAELQLSLSDLADESKALEIGKLIGAKYIMLGSMAKVGANVKINCRIIETETSEIIYTDSVRGSIDLIFDLEDELAHKIENHFTE